MADQTRDEFITSLAQGAAATHELFREYIKAGFTDKQALYLVAQQITAAVNNPLPQSPDG